MFHSLKSQTEKEQKIRLEFENICWDFFVALFFDSNSFFHELPGIKAEVKDVYKLDNPS